MLKFKKENPYKIWAKNTLSRLSVFEMDLRLEEDLIETISQEIENKENENKDMNEIYLAIESAVIWRVFFDHIFKEERKPDEREIDIYLNTYHFMLDNGFIIDKVLSEVKNTQWSKKI